MLQKSYKCPKTICAFCLVFGKMIFQLCFVTCLFKLASSSMLLWSPKDVQIPALDEFNSDHLKRLLRTIHNPTVVAFSSNRLDSARNFSDYLRNATASYVLNVDLNFDNVHELPGNDNDSNVIEETLRRYTHEPNVVVALVINDKESVRVKRKIESAMSTTDANDIEYVEPFMGPVLYSAVLPTDKTVEAMIYSSKPPLLKINENNINLGDSTFSNMDIRDGYTRLVVTIPIANGKISLRFRFDWLSSYWYFNFVEVDFVDAELKQYNLTLNREVMAPRRFSYHCGGNAIFVDADNDVELHLFDIQAQPDAHNHRFSDSYNCVPFTTAPILSGIFVTLILGVGLIVGLTALNNIKTMDKFDNHKTKQLSITVWE